jgi:hypothetical protein
MQVDAIGHRNGHATCTDCGRPLTDAASIQGGVGPICACKQQLASAATANPDPRLEASERTTSEEIPPGTTFPLDTPMDIHNPKGTASWARAMRGELASLWRDASCNLHRFRNYLRVFAEHNGAQYFADVCGAPFPSLWAFCTAN